MRLKLFKNFLKKFNILVFFNLTYLMLFSQLFAQSVNISGAVESKRLPIRDVKVTFIDNADTTKKFSAVTDYRGDYEVNIIVTSMGANQAQVKNFSLDQNYPNPFSSSTAISYKLKSQVDARVTIFDILGREIKRFTLGMQNTGRHNIVWDGRNQVGEKIAPGIYFYRLQAGAESQVRKMIYNSNFNHLNVSMPGMFSKDDLDDDLQVVDLKLSDFTIRLENTENTVPYIINKQIDNVSIKNDTTINFSVDYLITATLDFDSLHQTIRGFGASNILLWRADMTDSEIETAFGTGDGQLGFTILRIMVEADKNRWSLYVPTAKKVYDMGMTVIASPWYAPEQMVETVDNVSRVRHDMYEEYAAHLDSFVTFMAENDVPLYGISIQNEPDITDQWTSWTSSEMFTFMKEYAHLINGTNVMSPESFHFNRNYSDPILNDSVACANTDIVCGHIYGSGLADYPLARQKGKEVWMTEYLINSGNPPADLSIDTGWNGAMQTARNINGCMTANMSAYIWWYIVRYYGPIADGTYVNKGDVTKKGYVMSQFSRFVRPGDRRVNSKLFPPITDVYFSAYTDSVSSKEVIIAINSSSEDEQVAVTIQNGLNNTFTPYTSSEFKNVIQGEDIFINGNKIIMTLEASSITTFVSE